MKISSSLSSVLVLAALGLAACNKPTTINPPPEVNPIVVPGPAGPAGPQGMEGSKGETGKTPANTTVIVVPPEVPASNPSSSSYSLTVNPRSTP